MSGRAVFHVTRMLPGYRIPVLERLDRVLSGRLVVFHGSPPGSSSLDSLTRDQAPAFRTVIVRNRWVGNQRFHFQDPRPVLSASERPAVILAEESPRSISLPLLMIGAARRKIPVILWGHFSSNDRAFASNGLADRYRRFLARSADACVCYSEDIRESLSVYVPKDRVFVAPNTLDMDFHEELRARLATEGRDAVRRRLGISNDATVLISIGRLEEDKGVQLLPAITETLGRDRNTDLVVIGDGPKREGLRADIERRSLGCAVMTGALSAEDAAPYLFIADVMVLPGRAGLAINHAFAYGLPVVTRHSPHSGRYHGPEMAYLNDGVNARFVDEPTPEGFARVIREVTDNLELYRRAALQTARSDLAPQKMIEGIVEALRSVDIDV